MIITILQRDVSVAVLLKGCHIISNLSLLLLGNRFIIVYRGFWEAGREAESGVGAVMGQALRGQGQLNWVQGSDKDLIDPTASSRQGAPSEWICPEAWGPASQDKEGHPGKDRRGTSITGAERS